MASMDVIQRLDEMQRKLDEVLSSPPSSKKTHGLTLPAGLQKSVGSIVKKLREADENPLELDFNRYANNDVERVVKETRRLFSDQRWGAGSIEEAFKRVWRNLRDQEKRKEKGTSERHKERSKESKRRRTKLERRMKSITKTDWSPASKEKVRQTLVLDMTSPEVCIEGSWRRRPFHWESSRLARAKYTLDEIHQQTLTPRARRQLLPAVEEDIYTETVPPQCADSWCVSRNYDA